MLRPGPSGRVVGAKVLAAGGDTKILEVGLDGIADVAMTSMTELLSIAPCPGEQEW